MDIRVVDAQDEALVRRFWEIGRAADAAVRPYDFHPPWESVWPMYSRGRDDVAFVLLGAFDGPGMCGVVEVELPLHDNLHSATATYYVHPEAQRRGVGRALAAASYEVARERGRRVLVTETYAPLHEPSAGLLYAEAMGFRTALVDHMKVVDLCATESLWGPLEAAAAARHRDYRIVTWCDRVPDELVEDYCRLGELFFDQAPMGELDVEPERWDLERVRSREAANARRGGVVASAGALAPDGTLVGLTEVGYSRHAPHRAFQSGTLVDPAHRGRALGISVKVANHRQLRAQFPACRVLLTGNADVNVAMSSVNEALGYRDVERCLEMQRAL